MTMLNGLCQESWEGKKWKIQLESDAASIISFPQFNFLLPFVCWFVKSPVSVSKDKTRSASSSESGSDDVGSCSRWWDKAELIKNYDWISMK